MHGSSTGAVPGERAGGFRQQEGLEFDCPKPAEIGEGAESVKESGCAQAQGEERKLGCFMTRRRWMLGLAAPLLGAQNDVSFKSAVSMVHVDTEVLDKHGAIAQGLKISDFRVFDEGREQKLV